MKDDWASRFLKRHVYSDMIPTFYHDELRLVFTVKVWEQTPWYRTTWKFDYVNGKVLYKTLS